MFLSKILICKTTITRKHLLLLWCCPKIINVMKSLYLPRVNLYLQNVINSCILTLLTCWEHMAPCFIWQTCRAFRTWRIKLIVWGITWKLDHCSCHQVLVVCHYIYMALIPVSWYFTSNCYRKSNYWPSTQRHHKHSLSNSYQCNFSPSFYLNHSDDMVSQKYTLKS